MGVNSLRPWPNTVMLVLRANFAFVQQLLTATEKAQAVQACCPEHGRSPESRGYAVRKLQAGAHVGLSRQSYRRREAAYRQLRHNVCVAR